MAPSQPKGNIDIPCVLNNSGVQVNSCPAATLLHSAAKQFNGPLSCHLDFQGNMSECIPNYKSNALSIMGRPNEAPLLMLV